MVYLSIILLVHIIDHNDTSHIVMIVQIVAHIMLTLILNTIAIKCVISS